MSLSQAIRVTEALQEAWRALGIEVDRVIQVVESCRSWCPDPRVSRAMRPERGVEFDYDRWSRSRRGRADYRAWRRSDDSYRCSPDSHRWTPDAGEAEIGEWESILGRKAP